MTPGKFDHPFTDGAGAATRGAASARANGFTPPPNSHNGTGHTATTSSGYAWNDTGNAARLLDAGGRDKLRYVQKRRAFYVWDGNCWPEDETRVARNWMGNVLQAAYVATWKSGQSRAAQTEEAKFLLKSGDDHNIAGALARVADDIAVEVGDLDTPDSHP